MLQFLLFCVALLVARGSQCGERCDELSIGDNLLQVKAGMVKMESVGESMGCKNWCHDAARNGGISWAEKCDKARCASCAECFTTTTTTIPDLPSCQLQQGGSSSVPSGRAFTATLVKPSEVSGAATYAFETAPEGLNVNMRNGVVTWQPEKSQAGGHFATAVISHKDGSFKCLMTFTVTPDRSNPKDALYVSPSHGSDENVGTGDAPFASVRRAAEVASPGQTIYVRGGVYPLAQEEVVANAPGVNPVVITRLPGERVRFNVDTDRIGFRVPVGSSGVTFRGLELYGSAEVDDHWEVLRTSFWRVQDTRLGGKTGFDVDGEYVVIEDCVIHDLTQKAVNVYKGRYVTVRKNVIYNIGHTSLSGGHGIMRKWERNFRNADNPDFYRFDFFGNLIFAVEQRIYSFIPWKGYCHMVIDEGKGILLDITNDTKMKARVSQNLVLYGGVDGIRLKWNPNLEVQNNAVMTEDGRVDPVPDGITCKNNQVPIPNMTLIGNLVQSYAHSNTFDVARHFADSDSPSRVRDNFYAGGGEAVGIQPGVSGLGASGSVFKDPANLDFRRSNSVPSTSAGVSAAILKDLFDLAEDYAVQVGPSGWRHDHDGMVDAIMASAPMEHLEPPVRGASNLEEGREALYYKVKSQWYRDLCRCEELEMVLPHYGEGH